MELEEEEGVEILAGGGGDGMVSLIRNMVLEFVRINGMHSMPYLIVKKKI
jgi:GTPase involved in cell partitioning and DNA repair